MRTTVDFSEDVLDEARRRAVSRHVTISKVPEDAARAAFARDAIEERSPVHLTTYGGSGLRPGVNLDDNASLLDIMDGLE